MRKRIIYHNGVKGFTEVELFNIPANEMNILCLMGFDSDFNHFRRDIHSRYGCDLALEIVRYKHSRAAGDIQHPAAGFYSGVIKDLIYYLIASHHVLIPIRRTTVEEFNYFVFIYHFSPPFPIFSLGCSAAVHARLEAARDRQR